MPIDRRGIFEQFLFQFFAKLSLLEQGNFAAKLKTFQGQFLKQNNNGNKETAEMLSWQRFTSHDLKPCLHEEKKIRTLCVCFFNVRWKFLFYATCKPDLKLCLQVA